MTASRFLSSRPYSGANALAAFASSDDWTARQLADGIRWADDSCRIGGTLALALRRASAQTIARLIARMRADGVATMNDVPRWLNAKASRLILPGATTLAL